MKKFFVIILDIINSSKAQDRDAITRSLAAALAEINNKYKDDCWALFEITKGDEAAAVLKNIKHLYELLRIFQERLNPYKFRTVVYYDELTAGLDTHRSTIIDGPAFRNGNEKMLGLKKTQRYFALFTGLSDFDAAIEALINFLLWRWNDLTELQRQIVARYQRLQNQQKVAAQLGRTQQQIQDTLTRCKWEIIDYAEKATRELLVRIDEIQTS